MDFKDMFIAMGEGLGSDMSRQRLDQKIDEALCYGDFDLVDVLAEQAEEDGIEINELYKEDTGYVNYKLICKLEHEANDWVDEGRLDNEQS